MSGKFRLFLKDNVVLVTGIPFLIGLHYAWSKMQENPKFVHPSEKKDAPPIIGFRYVESFAVEKYNSLVQEISEYFTKK